MAIKPVCVLTRTVLFLLFASALICGFTGDSQQVTRSPGLRGKECTMEGFDQFRVGWEVVNLDEPFVVKGVRGCILAGNNPLGEWPDLPEHYIQIQIKRWGSDKVVFESFADGAGRFEIEKVPEGRYCFLATARGWKSIMGVIVVDKRAAEEWIVAFQMGIDR